MFMSLQSIQVKADFYDLKTSSLVCEHLINRHHVDGFKVNMESDRLVSLRAVCGQVCEIASRSVEDVHSLLECL